MKRFASTNNRYLSGFLIGTFLFSSCSSKPADSSSSSQSNEQTVSSIPPFETREPSRYQAVRTVSVTDSAGSKVIRRTAIARSEILRREESQTGDASPTVLLETNNGRFVLLPDAKIYSEITESNSIDPSLFEDSTERLLHTRPLTTTYQKLGSESISGRLTTKYRILVNSSAGTNVTVSETSMWVDESLGMPIRSETISGDGSRVLMELSNIVLEADPNLFSIPEGYTKVAASELFKRIAQKRVP